MANEIGFVLDRKRLLWSMAEKGYSVESL